MARSLAHWGTDFPRTLLSLRGDVDNLFDHFFNNDNWENGTQFTPHTNVAETENEFEVTVELPGMNSEDFSVEFHNSQLIIRGEKKQETKQEGKRFHRVERVSGQFQRVIPFSASVDEGKVSADYHDGILRIQIPKAEEAKPRRISINS